jgi:hypothetical protein
MRQPPRLFLALLLLLGGCASFGPLDRPQDFPLHANDHPFFDLHWRLDRSPGEVRADGLVEATRQGNFAVVYLELKGLDKDGREVSSGLGRTWSGHLYRWETIPFTVRLRPTGQEDRFELSVWAYDWASDNDGRN